MVDASSHVPLYSVVESTQRVYGLRLIFVSARTNKKKSSSAFLNNFKKKYLYIIYIDGYR
jgi:hypothetical protein